MALVESTEQRVAEGARRAIAAGGWQAATLTRIADEAGVSRMTLHRRGLGREEIFALLARDYEEAFRVALWPAVTGRGTGAERLQAMNRGIRGVQLPGKVVERDLAVRPRKKGTLMALCHRAGKGKRAAPRLQRGRTRNSGARSSPS